MAAPVSVTGCYGLAVYAQCVCGYWQPLISTSDGRLTKHAIHGVSQEHACVKCKHRIGLGIGLDAPEPRR